MNSLSRMDSRECPECGRRLRNSVFCHVCGQALCSWICYLAHVAAHARVARRLRSPRLQTRGIQTETDPQTAASAGRCLEVRARASCPIELGES